MTPKKIRMAVLAEATRPVPHPRRQNTHRARRGVFAGWLGTRGLDDPQLEAMAEAAVDAWHDEPAQTPEELHEWLGLSWDEYSKWASPGLTPAPASIGSLLRKCAADTIVDM